MSGPWRLVTVGTAERIDSGNSLDRNLPTAGGRLPGQRRLIPENRRFRLAGRDYRGTLLMTPGPAGVELIVETDLEAYLPGVLAAELGPAFPPAALRAQAVASRTYALHKASLADPSQSFDVADDQSDQVFRGTPPTDSGPLFEAVLATRGMVLLSRGRPLPAYFHSTCGGHTSSAHDVFGGAPVPGLIGVPCTFCGGARYYRWEVGIPVRQASRALGLGDGMTGIRPGQVDRGGRCLTLLLDAGATLDRSAAEVRLALGPSILRSTRISSIKVYGSEFRLEGGGWGHGVGLCQMGASGMARKGAAASDILSHYYPGAEVFRLY